LISDDIVKRLNGLIKEAEARAIASIKEGRVEEETAITDRFLDSIEHVFEESGQQEGFEFKARTLKDKGINAAESRYGADYVGVLRIRAQGFEIDKGFLSQAKVEGKDFKINHNVSGFDKVSFNQGKEYERLRDQTKRMLSISPSSFVTVYGLISARNKRVYLLAQSLFKRMFPSSGYGMSTTLLRYLSLGITKGCEKNWHILFCQSQI
jgi:hypothetical protein